MIGRTRVHLAMSSSLGTRPAGRVPSEEDMAKWTRVRPIMNEILQGKGLVEVAEGKVQVTGVKGPLEEGWQDKVKAFVARIPVQG